MVSPNHIRVLAVLTAMMAAVVAALLALFVLGRPAVAGSTDLLVNTTAEGNDGACEQPDPVTNPDADCTLREAIISSNTVDADAIVVPAGTYKLTITGSDEDLAATGDLDITKGVTIRGEGARNTIIDGNGIDRVFDMPDQGTPTAFAVNIVGVKVIGGAADQAGGGIRHLRQGATLNLSDSTVSGNSASQGGGIQNGLSLFFGGTMNIIRSTISGNKAPGTSQGGGIINAAAMTLENTTVSGNKTGGVGGGIMQFDGTLRITDSTIASNVANTAGGIYVSSTTNVKNAIVSNNQSNFPSNKNCSGSTPVTSEGNNLEKGTTCGFDQPTDINADPRLGDLANNGGPTNTRALLAGSPAIDAGESSAPTDQRGVHRPQGKADDIGAYEKKAINIVQCPTGGTSNECVGTDAPDELIGRDDDFDHIQGGEGDDIYKGKGSCDSLDDSSLTSSDRYLVTVKNFCNVGISSLSVRDAGGNSDTLDLSRVYKSTDFVYEKGFTNLIMDGPGVNNIDVLDFFTTSGDPTDSIDFFKFSDKTLTAQQVRDMIP